MADAALQVLAAATPARPNTASICRRGWTGWKSIRVPDPHFQLCSFPHRRKFAASDALADVLLLQPDGTPVAQFKGVQLQRVRADALGAGGKKLTSQWLYDVTWRAAPRLEKEEAAGEPATWLIMADDRGLAQQLAQRLSDRGQRAVLIRPGQSYLEDSAKYRLG